jgi:predicted MFS family arabinose efflux permease
MILWTSQVLSTVGTRVTSVAYPLLVLALTRSPAQAGIVAFAQTLPFLLLFLPAGALVDRWDRRRVMVVCEAGRAIALGSVAVTAALGTVTVPQLIVVAFVEGSLFVFFDLCEGAALPRLVPPEQLPTAIAQNQARTQGADLVGQPLGGALFSISRSLPFVFDAISYLVSTVALLFIRTPLQEVRASAPGSLRREIAEGLRTVWGEPFLRTSVIVVAGMNFVFNALTLVLIVRAQDLGAGPALIGAMFAFLGGGAMVGSVAAPWIVRRFRTRPIMLGIAWFWALELAALTVMPSVLAIGLVAGAGALAGPAFNVVLASVMYRLTPDRLLGRVRSVAKLVAWGSIPMGSLAAGFVAGGLGAVAALIVLAAAMVAVALVATLAPGMRRVPDATT